MGQDGVNQPAQSAPYEVPVFISLIASELASEPPQGVEEQIPFIRERVA
jgi:hypothetical protein